MLYEDYESLKTLGVLEVSPRLSLYRGARAEGEDVSNRTLQGRPWLYSQPQVAASYAYLYPGGRPVLIELRSRHALRVLSFSDRCQGSDAPRFNRLLGALLDPDQRQEILGRIGEGSTESDVDGVYVCFEQGGGRLYLWEPEACLEVTSWRDLPESWDLAVDELKRSFGVTLMQGAG